MVYSELIYNLNKKINTPIIPIVPDMREIDTSLLYLSSLFDHILHNSHWHMLDIPYGAPQGKYVNFALFGVCGFFGSHLWTTSARRATA